MTTVWGLVDDRTSHGGQVLGVIAALGLPYALKRLDYRPLANLPNALLGASFIGLTTATHATLTPPYPPLVIACGRRMVPVLRAIKRRSPSTRTVYLMWPESREGIDLVAVPEHDGIAPRDGVMTTLAPLHAVTPEILAGARKLWEPQFAHLPRPWVTLCLGGATRAGAYDAADWRDLLHRAQTLAGEGSLLITTSARTPHDALEIMVPLLQTPHLLHRWDADKDNPYLGLLACADAHIVTGDSLAMCAEACATGKPVFIYTNDRACPAKHRRLHTSFYEKGIARPLDYHASLDWKPATPLNDAGLVAAEITRRWGIR